MKTNTLSKRRIKRIVSCFASGLTAIDTAQKLKLHRNTINKYFRITREAIVTHQQNQNSSAYWSDLESIYYLGWNKNKGLCVDIQQPGTLIFAVQNKDGLVYVQQVDDEITIKRLQTAAIDTKGDDSNTAIHFLPVEKNGELLRIAAPPTIESFYNYAKEKLTKFYGVKPQYTLLYLKELEYRFNNRDKSIANITWKIVAQYMKRAAKARNNQRRSV